MYQEPDFFGGAHESCEENLERLKAEVANAYAAHGANAHLAVLDAEINRLKQLGQWSDVSIPCQGYRYLMHQKLETCNKALTRKVQQERCIEQWSLLDERVRQSRPAIANAIESLGIYRDLGEYGEPVLLLDVPRVVLKRAKKMASEQSARSAQDARDLGTLTKYLKLDGDTLKAYLIQEGVLPEVQPGDEDLASDDTIH